MPKPLSVKAWKAQALTDDTRRAETIWLNEHWTYGGRIHEETAKPIIGALDTPSDRAVGPQRAALAQRRARGERQRDVGMTGLRPSPFSPAAPPATCTARS